MCAIFVDSYSWKTSDHCVTKVKLSFVAIDTDCICLHYFHCGILNLSYPRDFS